MTDLKLPGIEGYDFETQTAIAMFAASLDDQLRRLRGAVEGLETEHLEWQERPGRNTIGMLMTHIAAVEIGWLLVSAQGIPFRGQGEALIREILGVEDDGFPLPEDGVHPECLRGLGLESYLAMLARARDRTHEVLRTWTDAELDATYEMGDRRVSRAWTVYHVLEHFAAHFGQINSIRHQLGDADLLA